MNKTDAFQYINDLPMNEYNKKNRGEVFTKMAIVEEQLSCLPNFVWKNRKIKWLDVASGVGNYSVYCYYKLMNSFRLMIPNRDKRSKHIIENMLFMVEIDIQNVEKCKSMFNKIDPHVKPNIFVIDFLSFHVDTKYDVIMGNPPYTTPNSVDNTKLSTRSLYPNFIAHSLNLLKKNGFLSFIHPVSWRRYSRESRFSFENYDILYMYTNNQFKGFGDCAPYINYYVIQNSFTKDKLTKYHTVFNNDTYKGVVSLRKLPFLPLLINEQTISIIRKLIKNNYDYKNNC